MAIASNVTGRYRFAVDASGGEWSGQGSGQAYFGQSDGIVGPRPGFELRDGWLKMRPTEGWTQPFPIRSFSDASAAAIEAARYEYPEAQKEAQAAAAPRIVHGDIQSYLKETNLAMAAAMKRRGLTRDLSSYAVFVGEALGKVLRSGDELIFSRNGGADIRYSVERNGETTFSAGAVGRSDDGGPFAVWQEYDRYANPQAEEMKKKMPGMAVAEWIDMHRPYVSARVKDRRFELVDGQEAEIHPYYVYLARSNRKVGALSFEYAPRAVHSAGCLEDVSKELVVDAAQRMMAPEARVL